MPKSMYSRDFSEENFLGAASEVHNSHAGGHFQVDHQAVDRLKTESTRSEVLSSLLQTQKWMGVFFDSHDAIGELTTSEADVRGSVRKQIGAIVTMRVKNRMIMLNCNSSSNTNANNVEDLFWAKDTCSKWATDIFRLNKSKE
jgi:hypothetical protein